jgi:hypothetical protein
VPIDSKALEHLSRDELIAKATALGANRPELLTRPELRDEIIRLSSDDGSEIKQARGWFGVARDLVASVVSQGLNLPDTADLIRGVNVKVPKAGPPVATVTLAEIYAAQGHVSKAIALLDEVLAKEPDHEAARLARQRYAPVAAHAVPTMPPEPEEELADTGSTQDEKGTLYVEPTELPLNSDVITKESVASEINTDGVTSLNVSEPIESAASETESDAQAVKTEESKVNEGTLPDVPLGEGQSGEVALGDVALGDVPLGDVPTVSLSGTVTELAVQELPLVEPKLIEPTIDEAPMTAAPSGSESSSLGHKPAETHLPENAAELNATTLNVEGEFRKTKAQIDEEPEEDLLLFVRRAGEQNDLIWQLGKRSKKRFDESSEPGRLVVKMLEVEATWDGPKSREAIIELRDSAGQRTVSDAKAAVRFVLGRQENDRFVPLCLGVEFTWDRLSGAKLRWSPPVTRSHEAWERLGQVRLGHLFAATDL